MRAIDAINQPGVRARLIGHQDAPSRPAKVAKMRARFFEWARYRQRLIDLVVAFKPDPNDAVDTLYPFDKIRYSKGKLNHEDDG